MNATGFLVNSAGQYLNGWAVNPTTGVADQNALVPIQVNQSTYNPVATQNVTLSANLPATPTAGTATTASPLSSQITVYDSLGTAHSVTLNWSQTPDPASATYPRGFCRTNGLFRSASRKQLRRFRQLRASQTRLTPEKPR